jgi:hypothetical protein
MAMGGAPMGGNSANLQVYSKEIQEIKQKMQQKNIHGMSQLLRQFTSHNSHMVTKQ